MLETNTLNEEISEIKTSKFSEISRQITIPLISILLAFVIGIVVLSLLGYNPVEALNHMTFGTFTDRYLATSLFYSTPLIFTGLSVAVAFRAGMFNIGTEGQMLMGGFTSALVGFGLQWNLEKINPNIEIPALIFVPLLLIAGAFGGAAWALVPALLKARGVHEVITTIMMNYIAATLLVFLVGGSDSPFVDQQANISPQTPKIPLTARLPYIFERSFSRLHWGFFIAILACIIVFILLWKTKLGYETRTVGYNPNAAKYGGIHVNRSLIKVMLISGALGGLAGSVEVMGQYFMYLDKSLTGKGFDGIAVALIGGNHPIGVIFGAILFGWLQTGGLVLQLNQFPKDIASALKGFIVFLVAVPMIAKMIFGFFGYNYDDSWLNREINRFWKRYNERKGNLIIYTRNRITKKPTILAGIIFLLLIPIYSTVSVFIVFLIIFLILISGWCLTLLFPILSNVLTHFLGEDIGGIFDLTNLSSVLNGLNNPISEIGIVVLGNLWVITGIIFIAMLIYNRKIVTMMLNSFIFITETCFFVLLLLYLMFLKKPYLYILRMKNDVKNRKIFQRIDNAFDWIIGLSEKLYFFEIVFATLLLFILNLQTLFFPSSLDSVILLGTTIISLIIVIFVYIFLKKLPKNRYTSNFSTEIMLTGFWIGSMVFFILLDIFGQEATLFGAIIVIAGFVLYQEIRASKQALMDRVTNIRNLDLPKDIKTMIKKYIFFIGMTSILFFFMVLGSDTHLPMQFNLRLFWLNNYGSAIGIIGILLILIGFYFLRGEEIISNPRDVYYLHYLYNGLSMIFIFFSFATFLSKGKAEYALFSVIFGSLLLTAIYIVYFELIVKKNSEIMTKLRKREFKTFFSENKTKSLFLLFSNVTVLLTIALSYTGIFSSYYFIPIVTYSLVVVIGILLVLIATLLNKKKPLQPTIEESERIDNNNQLVRYYSIIFSYLILVSIFINYIPVYHLPMQWNLFFFFLKDFGSAFGLLGLILVIFGFIFLKRIPLADKINSPKYLSLVYYLLSILVIFQALYTFFSMDPFSLISLSLVIASPIGFAALGGMFSEKSGVVNIGLEGMMLTGAFSAVWFTSLTGNPWIGVLGSVIAGALMGLLHAIASIKFRADQVVVGVALNLLASALTTLGIVVVWGTVGQSDPSASLKNITMEFLLDIPVFGEFLYKLSGSHIGLSPLVYMFILSILLSAWVIQRTRFGLRVRAVGEKPRAADTLGIDVFKMRYIAVILSGILAAVGGAQLTIGWVPIFGKDMTTGRGFVALAALIFGGWNPIGAALASLLFGFTIAFRFQLDILFRSLGLNWVVLDLHLEKLTPMLPFVITIITVAIVAKRMRPPAADGIPYVKEG